VLAGGRVYDARGLLTGQVEKFHNFLHEVLNMPDDRRLAQEVILTSDSDENSIKR